MKRDKHGQPPPEELFDEISRINNELVNAQRELAKQKAELDRQHERLKAVVAALPNAHLVLGGKGAVLFANQAARTLLGKGAKRGEAFALEQGKEQGAQARIEGANGPRTVEVYSSQVWWGRTRSTLVSLIDVTEREAAREEAGRKDRLQGVLEMAGSAAHNLAQPLQTLFLDLDYIFGEVDTSGVADAVKSVETSRKRLAELMQRIQRITRYELAEYSKDLKIIDLDKAAE